MQPSLLTIWHSKNWQGSTDEPSNCLECHSPEHVKQDCRPVISIMTVFITVFGSLFYITKAW